MTGGTDLISAEKKQYIQSVANFQPDLLARGLLSGGAMKSGKWIYEEDKRWGKEGLV